MKAQIIQLIEVTEVLEGTGQTDDPCRHVTYLYTLDGKLVDRIDGWARQQQQSKEDSSNGEEVNS